MVTVNFVRPSGEVQKVDAKEGETLLSIAHAHGIDIEGACEGAMACSTCHVIVDERWSSKLPPPSEEELDMLDLTYGLTRTSRLGCQIKLTAELDDLTVQLPTEIQNMMD